MKLAHAGGSVCIEMLSGVSLYKSTRGELPHSGGRGGGKRFTSEKWLQLQAAWRSPNKLLDTRFGTDSPGLSEIK